MASEDNAELPKMSSDNVASMEGIEATISSLAKEVNQIADHYRYVNGQLQQIAASHSVLVELVNSVMQPENVAADSNDALGEVVNDAVGGEEVNSVVGGDVVVNPKIHKCRNPGCSRAFASPRGLKMHMRTHIKCRIPGCSKAFTSERGLRMHLRTHV